jgi:ADP-ribosylglycohydrolase
LCDVPEIYARRAPGTTCLSGLYEIDRLGYVDDYIANPKNNSKGCGGVMRIAPLALNYNMAINVLDMEAAQIAAITHGHSLGYMPAAVLCHIINRIVFPTDNNISLKEIVVEAKKVIEIIFKGDKHLGELSEIIDRAIALSENNLDDLENIRALGQGWVAEETLAIAIYCSLRYENDFSKGIIAAVNHSGDSDSTGAVTGNILGALVGYEAIDDKWKKDLECADIIIEMADDICHGCQMSEYSSYRDASWELKYMDMHWKTPVPRGQDVSDADL